MNMYSQCSLTKSQARPCPSRLLATAAMTKLASCLRIKEAFRVEERYLQEEQKGGA